MPSADLNPYTVVKAVINRGRPHYVEGVQRIGRLWRIYMSSLESRINLLTRKTVIISGKEVPLYEQNPFRTNQMSPMEKKDKLTVKGLPLSVSSQEIKNLLESNGVVLSSSIKFSQMRDEDGNLTRYKNGDRYMYCEPFKPPLPRQQNICGFQCLLYHHGVSNFQCRSCNTVGHKSGDEICPAKTAPGTVLAFSGYLHPLSNHFMTPITAFGETVPFKSVEHAFFWRMTCDLGMHDLAARIRDADHAGIVKRLSKEVEESVRFEWESEHEGIMRELLVEKAKSCTPFRNCLLMNQDKVLAECTQNMRWGTGLSKWVTENTKGNFWPGDNLLGKMLMDIAEEQLLTFQQNTDTDLPSSGDEDNFEDADADDEREMQTDESAQQRKQQEEQVKEQESKIKNKLGVRNMRAVSIAHH